jgi:hypothetical protein
MTKPPVSVAAALLLLLLNALVWLAFAVLVAAGAHPSIPHTDLVKWTMAVLAFLNAVVLMGLCGLLRRGNHVAYYLTLGLLVVLSLLTVADQFGISDLIVLILLGVPLVLLVKDRAWYLQPTSGTPDRS